MTERLVKKNLIGIEDLQYGEGSSQQTRAGGQYTITDVRSFWPVNSTAELNNLEPSLHPKAALVQGGTCTFYQFANDAYTPLQLINGDEFDVVDVYIPLTSGKVWNDAEGGAHTLFTFKVSAETKVRQVTISPIAIAHGTRNFTVRLLRKVGIGGSYVAVDTLNVTGNTEFNIYSRLLYNVLPINDDVFYYVEAIPFGTSGAALIDPQRVQVTVAKISGAVIGA
jgi:hypothetical protein